MRSGETATCAQPKINADAVKKTTTVLTLPAKRFRITILLMINKYFSPGFTLILAQCLYSSSAFAATAAKDAPTSSNVGMSLGALDSLIKASPVVQLTILILITLSILSWAIGWAKYKQFKILKTGNTEFD